MPVADQCLVDLSEDGQIVLIHSEQLLVGSGTQIRVIAAGIHGQLAAGEVPDLAVDRQVVDITVGDRIIDAGQRVGAVDILEIDDLFLVLSQGERLLHPQVLEEIAVIAGGFHQAGGIFIIQVLPPQLEEQRAVVGFSDFLLEPGQVRQRFLVLGIFSKPQVAETHQAGKQPDQPVVLVEDFNQFL